MSKSVPTQINHEAINTWKVKTTLLLMGYEEKDAVGRQQVLRCASEYFTRITQVLQFLVYVRGVDNIKQILPEPFFLPSIYDRPHLALQRHGSRYDGKYYILDQIGSREELATEMRTAELADIRWALIEFDETDGLQQLILQLDKQTSNTPNSAP